MLSNRDKLIATLILTCFFIFAYIHYFRFWNPPRPEIPEKLGVLDQVPSFEGFRYYPDIIMLITTFQLFI